MNNQTISLQTITSINFVKTSLSLYFFTLGSSFLGLSLYLFLETVGYTDKIITTWSGQGAFWAVIVCLLYTSPSPRDCRLSRMPSSA